MNGRFADCIVLTHDNKILLQQRPEDGRTHSGALCAFGGHVEEGETVIEAVVRELCEELGASVDARDLIFIGEFTEDEGSIVYVHFWHDKGITITGCYEGEEKHYKTVAEALLHPKIMPYLKQALLVAKQRDLLG